MTELSRGELDRAVLVALGWMTSEGIWTTQAPSQPPSSFASSLDACFGPGGITDWASAHGLDVGLDSVPGKIRGSFDAYVTAADASYFANDASAATALCRAFLLAREQVGE